jgi:hypothetical protein
MISDPAKTQHPTLVIGEELFRRTFATEHLRLY